MRAVLVDRALITMSVVLPLTATTVDSYLVQKISVPKNKDKAKCSSLLNKIFLCTRVFNPFVSRHAG